MELQQNQVLVGSSGKPQGLRERIGRFADMPMLGRENPDTGDITGLLEFVNTSIAEVAGTDAVGREVQEYSQVMKSGRPEIAQTSHDIRSLAPEVQTDRLSGGVSELRTEVATLLTNIGHTGERQHEIAGTLQTLDAAYKKAAPANQHAIEASFNDLVPARQDWGNHLGQLLKAQDHVNDIDLAHHLAGRHHYRVTHEPQMAGGDISQAFATLKGIPSYVREMGMGLLDPRGFSQARVRELVSKVRADVLAHADKADRFRMYEQGILTAKQVGQLTDADRAELMTESRRNDVWNQRRQESFTHFDKGETAHRKATMHGEINFYRSFETKKLKQIRHDYEQAEKRYKTRVGETMSLGIWREMFHGSEHLAKLGQALEDGTVYLVKDVRGEIQFTYEGLREGILNEAHAQIAGSVAGREYAAKAYQQALTTSDSKRILSSARALRGAEMMFQRSALWVARANQHFERGIAGAPKYVADRLLNGWLGGGKRVDDLSRALADRSKRILGEGLLENNRKTDLDSDTAQNLQLEITDMAQRAGVPSHCESQKAQDDYMDKAGIFGIKFRKGMTALLDKVVGSKAKEGFWQTINYGSRRQTLDNVLGVNDLVLDPEGGVFQIDGTPLRKGDVKEKGLFSNMLQTRQALAETQGKAQTARTDQSADLDSVISHGSLTVLQMAQERYLQVEMRQMKRRNQLDRMYARTLKGAVTLPVAGAALLYGREAVQHLAEQGIQQAGDWVAQLTPKLATATRIYNEALQTTTYNGPPGDVQQIRDWAVQSGGNEIQMLKVELQAAGQLETQSANVAMIVGKAEAYIAGIAVAIGSIPTINTGVEVVKGLFHKKTSIGAPKPTIR